MKLPATLLATLALAGCEKVDFEHRSAPPPPAPTATKAPVETIRIIETQPAAAPKWSPPPPPQPTVIPTPPAPPKVRPKHSGCGDGAELVKCGMG